MKKLLSVFAAAAMLFGFASCSGDLHDDVKIDPNAMIGYWSYIVLKDTNTCTSGKIAVITSGGGAQSGAYGADPYTFDVEDKGTHAVIWDGKDETDIVANTRTDCPSLSDIGVTLKDGEMCLFVFTTASTCDVWAWDTVDTDVNITGGIWPGLKTTATVEVEMVNVVINGATVTANGLPEALNGTTLYFTGGFNNWTAPGEEGTIEGTVTNGSITITLPELSAEVAQGAAQEIIVEGKFANTGWSVPEIAGLINEKQDGINNVKVTITPSKKTIVGTYSANNLADKYECTWEVE